MPLDAPAQPTGRSQGRFHKLTIAELRRETEDAVAIAFDIPEALRDAFAFRPGQYLTLKAEIDGEEVRRSYSICSKPGEPRLTVGVKRLEGGRFSSFANARLAAGDALEVLPPEGRFGLEVAPSAAHDYLMIAAGSGVTPMLSMIAAVLEGEPESRVTLLYGNRRTASIMFHEPLEDLKDRFLERFRLIHCLSREPLDAEILSGRIDAERLRALAERGLIDPRAADAVFLCGPGEMIDVAEATLTALGVDPERIKTERFTPAADAKPRPASAEAEAAAEAGVAIETILDGARRAFTLRAGDASVLEAARAAGVELPYSCAGGMCCTCRAKVLDGAAEMALNYSLEPWEIEAGFILTCQARPTTERLVLDFDAV